MQGKALSFNVISGSSQYGQAPVVVANLFTIEDSPIAPTGTVTVKRNGVIIGQAPVGPAEVLPGLTVWRTYVPLPSIVEPQAFGVTVEYSGDTRYSPQSSDSTVSVLRRSISVVLDSAFPSSVAVGDPVILTGHLVVPPGMPSPPTGTLRLQGLTAFCEVTLNAGATGGSCVAQFPTAAFSPEQVYATYSGDSRYFPGNPSEPLPLTITQSRVAVRLTTDSLTTINRVWSNFVPVKATWDVLGAAAATGPVEIWTNEGKQSCPTTPVGTCNVRFTNATEDGWIEARFLGDQHAPPLGRPCDRAGARVASPSASSRPGARSPARTAAPSTSRARSCCSRRRRRPATSSPAGATAPVSRSSPATS